jgi:hypothetical protein
VKPRGSFDDAKYCILRIKIIEDKRGEISLPVFLIFVEQINPGG